MTRFEFPIEELSFSQKLDLMEMLWTDIAADEKSLEPPGWHDAVLRERAAALDAGKISVSDWKIAKERIKKNVS